MVLKNTPPSIFYRHVTVITRNLSALAVIRQPRQQSGQDIIRQIYQSAKLLKQRGNSVYFMWIPAESDFTLGED